MKNNLERMWKEEVVANFKSLYQYFWEELRKTKRNFGKDRCRTDIFRVQSRVIFPVQSLLSKRGLFHILAQTGSVGAMSLSVFSVTT
jgi:hypothetical protein